MSLFRRGAGDGTRTRNLLITNQLLCQLSYTSTKVILSQGSGIVNCFLVLEKNMENFGAKVKVPEFLILLQTGKTAVLGISLGNGNLAV